MPTTKVVRTVRVKERSDDSFAKRLFRLIRIKRPDCWPVGEKYPVSFFHLSPVGAIRRAGKRIYDYNRAVDKSDARWNANEQRIHCQKVEEIDYRIDILKRKRVWL